MRSTPSSVLTLLVTSALTLGVAACKPVPAMPPPRPASVPAAAVWAGGPDGGAWIQCTPAARDFDCTIFHDSGDVWTKGRFRAEPASAAGKGLQYNAYDGELIHLLNGEQLVPASGG